VQLSWWTAKVYVPVPELIPALYVDYFTGTPIDGVKKIGTMFADVQGNHFDDNMTTLPQPLCNTQI
jgi:hypothetical protein